MRNLGKEFSDEKICVKVKNVSQIDTLVKVVGNWLFEDTSVVNSKLYHGLYTKWFNEDKELSLGLVGGLTEVLSDRYFEENNYEQVECNEFIENLRKW